MKIGIMQPYFMPYIGYWQLINAVDKYVIFDDVNYIKRGWINRNRILIDGKVKYLNIPLMNASQNRLINEIDIVKDSKLVLKKIRTIEYAYKKAPYFEMVFPLIEKILNYQNPNLMAYIENSIYTICQYLNIKTDFFVSSSLKKNNELKGQKKILEICELLNATEYYNAIGGQNLYSLSEFDDRGIKLKFIRTNEIVYRQFNDNFQPNLSIIDVLMFNSKEKVDQMLYRYSVVV